MLAAIVSEKRYDSLLPSEKEVLWSSDTITGVEKFALNKFYPMISTYRDAKADLKCYFKSGELSDFEWDLYIKLNQTIKKASESFDKLQFNTAIAALMELARDYDASKIKNDKFNDYVILKAIQMSAPLIPHMAEHMWEMAGYKESIFKSSWPEFDPDAIIGDTIEVAIQINGKLRDTVQVSADADQSVVEKAAFDSEKIKSHTADKQIVKIIFVKGRILNIVVKG